MTQATQLWQEHHAAMEELMADEKATPLQEAAILFIASYCYKLTSAETDAKLHAIPKAPGLQSVLQDTAHKFRKTVEKLADGFPEEVLTACCACWPVDKVSQNPGRKILPPEVDALALKLLGIEPGDTLIDLWGHGASAFLTAPAGETAHTNFYSLEQDSDAYLLSFLRSRCRGGKVQPLPINCLYAPLPPALKPARLYLDATGLAAPEVIGEKNRSIRQELSQYMREQELINMPTADGEAALQEVFKNLQVLNAIMLQGQQEKCRAVIICEAGRLTEAALSGSGIPGKRLELAARLPARLAPGLAEELDLLLLGQGPYAEPRLVDVSNLGEASDGLTKLRQQDLEKILILCQGNVSAVRTKTPPPPPKPGPQPPAPAIEPPAQQETQPPAPPEQPGQGEPPAQREPRVQTEPPVQGEPTVQKEPPAEAEPSAPIQEPLPAEKEPPTPTGEPLPAEKEPPVPREMPQAKAPACPLKDLIKTVQRGPALTNSKLQPLRSEKATSCRYLNLKDIADGLLSMEMDSLTEMPEKYRKYCLQPGDVVLTKTTPFKAASFDSEEQENLQILPGANIYRLEPDREKILPSYLTLYLQSPQGQEQLARHAKGKTSVLIISVQELLELTIPLPSLEEQNQLATKYRRFRKRLLETLHRAAEIRQKMEKLL